MAATGVIADFELPAILEAAEPAEARGLRRDEVRLLVSDLTQDSIAHARFHELPRWLSAGDVLVVNTSGTLNAALRVVDEAGEPFELHLSTRLPGGFWSVEVRRLENGVSTPCAMPPRARFRLPADGRAALLAPYPLAGAIDSPSRLWIAAVQVPGDLFAYLDRHGFPIRYGYVPHAWPGSMYQTVFATDPGSAEMPSAARPFTPELVTRLVSRGVEIAPLVLHTGVSSLETHEPPYEEFYRVSANTAARVTAARRGGRRIVAVGTTVVRALETVTDERGTTSAGEGWTSVVITAERPVRSVNGLITGLHEPRASHLALLQEVAVAALAGTRRSHDAPFDPVAAGRQHLERAYAEARRVGYLWHEFGDAHLIVGEHVADAVTRR
jgi:S-adenosylmethionine:tRNA ribosyltransferase-isomerase